MMSFFDKNDKVLYGGRKLLTSNDWKNRPTEIFLKKEITFFKNQK